VDDSNETRLGCFIEGKNAVDVKLIISVRFPIGAEMLQLGTECEVHEADTNSVQIDTISFPRAAIT